MDFPWHEAYKALGVHLGTSGSSGVLHGKPHWSITHFKIIIHQHDIESLISEEGFFDVVSFKLFWILEIPRKILLKSFMSLSWTCFAVALILFKLYVAFSGLTPWQVCLQDRIWSNDLQESQGKTGKKLVFSMFF